MYQYCLLLLEINILTSIPFTFSLDFEHIGPSYFLKINTQGKVFLSCLYTMLILPSGLCKYVIIYFYCVSGIE